MTGNRKTVGLDADGVLYNFVGAASKWSGFMSCDATEFDIFKAWGKPDLWPHFDAVAQSPGFCLDLELLPGAQDFVAELKAIADVLIVTSPYRNAPTWAYERECALKRDFGIEREWVMSVRSKQYAKVDILIDDRPSNVEAFPGPSILIDQPWNRKCVSGFRRSSWGEVLATVRCVLE